MTIKTKTYQVVVGNIGRVYQGTSKHKAMDEYHSYLVQSIDGGRVGGEPVTIFEDGEILQEYEGTLQEGGTE